MKWASATTKRPTAASLTTAQSGGGCRIRSCQDCWHRCCCDIGWKASRSSSLQPTCQNMGGVWHGTPLFAYQHQQNLFYSWRVEVTSLTSLPRIHWVWLYFAVPGIGKMTAWRAWHLSQVTPALEHIAAHPFQHLSVSSEKFQMLERFTVIMYDQSSPLISVNETRMMLFSKRNRDLDHIPPTQVKHSVNGSWSLKLTKHFNL